MQNILTPLDKARIARQKIIDNGEKIERLNPIQKSIKNPKSLRLAINAKCYECVGGEDGENQVKYIRECTSPKCPLFNIRPYRV